MKSFKILLPAAFLIGFCGCGSADKPPAYANVSGKVSYNGKPIEKGTITFTTDGRPPTILDIADGKFSGQAMTGSNKVSVSYPKKSAKVQALPADVQDRIKRQGSNGPMGSQNPNNEPSIEPGAQDIIPPEWGSSSKQLRVVNPGTTNDFEFDIKGP